MVFSSNHRKEAHFILTKSGWLHQFESKIDPSKSAPSPIRSLNLASKSLSPVIEDDSEKQNEFLLVDYPVRSIKDYLNGDKFRFDTEVDDWVNSISKFTRVNSSAASIKSATSASSRKFSLFRSNSFVASRKSIESVRSNTTANSRKASWWGGKVEDVELEPKPKKMDKGKEKVKFTPSTVGGSVITEVVDTTEVLQVEKPKKKMFSFLKRGNLSPSFPVA